MPQDEAAARSLASFGAAAEDYDSEAQSFFPRFGQLTVERLALVPGERVLDVACGTGNSVLPAANAVGASGSVLGVDLTQQMLDIARVRVDAAGFTNVELVCADMRDLDLAPQSFDAVVSVFGIFFVPDMAGLLADLWDLVAPGGTLAVTTWGPDLFEPLWSTYWNAVQAERPELRPAGGRYDEISLPAGVQVLFAQDLYFYVAGKLRTQACNDLIDRHFSHRQRLQCNEHERSISLPATTKSRDVFHGRICFDDIHVGGQFFLHCLK